MASVKRASWAVAASVATVEALKDQAGLCRWDYALRSLHHHAKNNFGSFFQVFKMSSSAVANRSSSEKVQQSEESLRKVMYLSCWGPN